MAGRRYSAGRIFLQVVPSFDNLQRQIGNEVRKANRGLAKEQEELGEELGEARARGTEKAERAAQSRRKTQAKKDAKDLTEAMDALYVDPIISRLKKLSAASDQVRIQEIARTTRALQAQRSKEFQAAEKARAREREADQKAYAQRVSDFQKWTQQTIAERLKMLAAAEDEAYRENAIREKALEKQRKTRADHMAWVIKSTVDEAKRVAAEEEKARRERETAEAAHQRRMEAAQDKVRRRRISSRLADMRAADTERRRLAGGAVGGRIRRGAAEAADAIGVMRITADSSQARAEIAAIRQELLGLRDAQVGVDLDAADAMARIEMISARLKMLQSNDAEVDVNANATAALIALKRVEQQVDQINHKTARGGMLGMFMGAKSSAEDGANSFRIFNIRVLGLLTLLPLLPPLLASAAAGIGALATAAVGGVAGLGVLVAGLWGIQDAVSAMGEVQDNAAKDALASSKAIRTASKGVRDAEQGMSRARTQAARAAEDASRRVADARRNVVQVERDVARSIRDALRAQRDAEQDLARAQRDATDAQKDLMDARRQAQREQDDLADRIAGGKLDERQALIDLFNAQVAYNAAMADGGATNLEREQAAISLERAQLAIKGIRKENADLQAEQRKGVAGSQVVAAAQERVVSTQEALVDAQQRARDAEESAQEARIRGTEQIADAQRGLSDALREQQQTAADNALAIRDAQERLTDAQAAYGEALTKTGELGSASMEKLRIAMGKLSPEGQKFATFIFGLQGYFRQIQAIAQAGFLPELQGFLQGLITRYGPSFLRFVGVMAEALGRFFVKLGQAFESPVMVDFFETMAQYAPIFFDFWGEIGISFLKIIAGMMTAFAPFAEMFMQGFADLMAGWAEWAAGLEDNPAFQEFIAYVIQVGPRVLGLIGDLLKLVINIGIGLADNGMFDAIVGFIHTLANMDPSILATLVSGIIGLMLASQVAAGINSLIISFMLLTRTPIGLVVLGLFAIGAALVLLYQHNETFRQAVSTAWTFIQQVFSGFMAWIQSSFIPWWTQSAQPVINAVFGAIAATAQWLWFNILQPIFTMFWEIAGYSFRIIAALWVNILWPVFKAIGVVIGWLWSNVAFPAFSAIGELWATVVRGVKWVWDNILSHVFEAIASALEGDFVGAWQAAVKAIEGIWNGLKKIAAVPVNFIIGTVLNDGLFAAFNKVMEFFGSSTRIKPLPLVTWGDQGAGRALSNSGSRNKFAGEFYAGGWTGPGAKYQPAGIVHADEFVVRKEATNKIKATYGLDLLEYINTYGEIPMFGAGYAIGGMVKPVNARPAFPWGRYPSGGRHRALDLQAAAGTPIVSPYPGKIFRDGWDGTGFGTHVRLAASGGGAGTFWILGHMLKEFVRIGQQVAAGQLLGLVGSTGRSSGPHLHLEGRTSPYNPDSAFDFTAAFNGGRSVTGAAAQAAANLPWWAAAPFDFMSKVVNAGLNKLPNMGLFDDLLKGGINKLMGAGRTFLGSVLGGGDLAYTDAMGGQLFGPGGQELDYNGVQAFDAGGLLQPGITTVLNMTGKPEPVFTDDQWRAGGADGPTSLIGMLDLDVNGTDLTASDVVDELMQTLTRVSHGGKYAGRAR